MSTGGCLQFTGDVVTWQSWSVERRLVGWFTALARLPNPLLERGCGPYPGMSGLILSGGGWCVGRKINNVGGVFPRRWTRTKPRCMRRGGRRARAGFTLRRGIVLTER